MRPFTSSTSASSSIKGEHWSDPASVPHSQHHGWGILNNVSQPHEISRAGQKVSAHHGELLWLRGVSAVCDFSDFIPLGKDRKWVALSCAWTSSARAGNTPTVPALTPQLYHQSLEKRQRGLLSYFSLLECLFIYKAPKPTGSPFKYQKGQRKYWKSSK